MKSAVFCLLALSVPLLLGVSCTRTSAKTQETGAALETLFADAKQAYEAKKYLKAKQVLERVKQDYPGNEILGEVQLYIALCDFGLKDFGAAENGFRSVRHEFPNSAPYAGQAQYYLALSIYRQTPPADRDQEMTLVAIQEFKDFLSQFPQSEYAPEARKCLAQCHDKLAQKDYLIGRLYRRLDRCDAAIIYFQELYRTYPASRWSWQGLYESALCYYNDREPQKVLDLLGQLDEARLGAQAGQPVKLPEKLARKIAKLKAKIIQK